jgi:hypothetical protein
MREAISLKTEISYEDLVSAYAPIRGASQFIENAVRVIDRKNDDGFAAKFFGEILGQLERARTPLEEIIDRIEKENPDQFSWTELLTARDGPFS